MITGTDEQFLTICDTVASEEYCTHRNVGAVVVEPDSTYGPKVRGQGRNTTVPVNGPLCFEGGCARGQLPRGEGAADYSDCSAVHAEFAAIFSAGPEGCRGATLYVNSLPCTMCWKMIGYSGLARVVWRGADGKVIQRQIVSP